MDTQAYNSELENNLKRYSALKNMHVILFAKNYEYTRAVAQAFVDHNPEALLISSLEKLSLTEQNDLLEKHAKFPALRLVVVAERDPAHLVYAGTVSPAFYAHFSSLPLEIL